MQEIRYTNPEDVEPDEEVRTFLSILLWHKRLGGKGKLIDYFFRRKSLLEVSNRFCRQCGSCCPQDCLALEKTNGKAYCKLHGEDGPPAEFYPKEELDPTKSKPWECVLYGPGDFHMKGLPYPCTELISKTIEKLEGELYDHKTLHELLSR